MELDIIIVTHNSSIFIEKCLNSIFENCKDLNKKIQVIDNASKDNTCNILEKFKGEIHFTTLEKNLGFASGCNIGIRQGSSEFIMLLNPDAYLNSDINSIFNLLNEKRVGVVGIKILNPDGSIQQSCYKFPDAGTIFFDSMYLTNILKRNRIIGDYKYWNYSYEREVDWVIGACMFLKRQAVESVGLFDENFFLYGEETDLCLRLKKNGWKIFFSPHASVVHIGRGSYQTFCRYHPSMKDSHYHSSIFISDIKFNENVYKSIAYYFTKHYGRKYLFLVNLIFFIGSLWRIAFSLPLAIFSEKYKNILIYHWRRIMFYLTELLY